MRQTGSLALLFFLLPAPAALGAGPFERRLELVEEGNRSFQEQHFQQALEAYEQAEQKLHDQPLIHFNRAAALYKLGRHKEAREAFLRAMGVKEAATKKKNLYNIGNTFLAEGALEDAAAYFRRALELDPQDDDARFNLELVLRAMEERKKQADDKKKSQSQDKGQEKSDKQQKDQDQQKKDQDQKDRDKKDQGDQEKKDGQQQEGQQEKQEGEGKQTQQQENAGAEENPREGEDRQEGEKKSGAGQESEPPEEKMEQQTNQSATEKQAQGAEENSSGEQQDNKTPARMSPAQVQALLRAMKENEKPFQMNRFAIPEFRQRQVDKDW